MNRFFTVFLGVLMFSICSAYCLRCGKRKSGIYIDLLLLTFLVIVSLKSSGVIG